MKLTPVILKNSSLKKVSDGVRLGEICYLLAGSKTGKSKFAEEVKNNLLKDKK
jgi:hypothetical protein